MTDAKTLCRAQLRRQAILDAATELFLEKGYSCTSLSDIVSRSKGSRTTVYELFGSKEGLLNAMVEEVTGKVWEVIGEDDPSLGDEEALVAMSKRFIDAVISPRNVAVYRILVGEGNRLPDIARMFFERGPCTLYGLLAARFQPWLKPGHAAEAPERTARLFLGAVMGPFHLISALGLDPKPTAEEIDAHIRLAVRLFLDGLGRP